MKFALEGTALSKRYGRTWALFDCSINLPQGRVAALVGPNGAGKTTLLNLAAGLLSPTSGQLRVLGRDPSMHAALILPRIGFLAQDAPLYWRWTVEEMLRLGRELNPRWDQAKAVNRLRRLRIPLDRRIGQLSGGQKAQVALALALAKRPELLLLDEPLASLDPLARHDFLLELTEAALNDGLTVVMSSHAIGDMERICDYLLLVTAGHLQVAGEIDQLMEHHALLVGPRVADGSLVAGVDVIRETHSQRQSSLWVRANQASLRVDPVWEVKNLSLEEIVIAYLSTPASGSLPDPVLVSSGR
ncbi:MAG: ABC transporter ATP-binding protein [Candidatus Dormiibacterota bacterium]